MKRSILGFQGTYRFLSNFYIEPDGTHVEGEYQAQKCSTAGERIIFMARALSPGQAKRAGRLVTIRQDWERVKDDVMYELVSQKFLDHQSLADRLIATDGYELVEENNWGDKYWGKVNGEGLNKLGETLMRVRAELMEGTE